VHDTHLQMFLAARARRVHAEVHFFIPYAHPSLLKFMITAWLDTCTQNLHA
jgi:hypothetical protein